ncbi:MAG: SRPBCC family protein [Bacteroidota bacterium]
MTTLITIVLVIAGLIALALIVALFTKSEYTVVREIGIGKSRGEVFEYVKYLKNQDHYNKWTMMDPNVRKDYRGTDATVGFVSTWDSDNRQVGKGEMEIKKIAEGERVDYEIRFAKPFEAVSPAYIAIEDLSNGNSKVIWGFAGKLPYPMNIMLLFINIPGMLEKDMDTSLAKLKTILEK